MLPALASFRLSSPLFRFPCYTKSIEQAIKAYVHLCALRIRKAAPQQTHDSDLSTPKIGGVLHNSILVAL